MRTGGDTPWIVLSIDTDVDYELGAEYQLTRIGLIEALEASDEWRSWWKLSRKDELHVFLYLGTSEPESFGIRKGRNRIRVNISRPRPGFRGPIDSPSSAKARLDIATILSSVQEELNMPALPTLPKLSDPQKTDVQRLDEAYRRGISIFDVQ